MYTPKVSVIIPAYNGANFLGETIHSVLGQTYANFEIIVVDDASQDNTAEIIGEFDDTRLKYIVHDKNQGADIARKTGLQMSSGEVIAFLDQDDFFHPEKLQAHMELLENYPDIGLTYNSRFELNYSAKTIRGISRPPRTINLADLVLWFPLSPSDVALRRNWALQMDLANGTRGAEIAHFGSLFLAGCKFACVDRALNYRRYHSGRIIKNLSGACASELNNQVKIFSDPCCPAEVLALREIAHANIYMYWAYLAFAQEETALGQEFVREAARLKPSILRGTPCELVNNILINSIDDENQNHESLQRRIFAQLPTEMAQLSEQYSWTTAHGYLLKGARAILWDRPEEGSRYFKQASKLGAEIDEPFLQYLTKNLLDYEAEFGEDSAQKKLLALAPYIKILGGRVGVRRFAATYAVTRAFQNYRRGEFGKVPGTVLQAISKDPQYITNRGVLAILLRSTVRMWNN